MEGAPSTALALARAVRERDVRVEDLVARCLDAIAARDDLHAFVYVTADAALRTARAMDRRLARRRRGPLPPLYGVPTAIKDLNLARGTFTRFGSRAFSHFWSPVDDRVVASLRRAGLVFLGKLATAELGAMPVTEPATHPPTRNPWDPSRTAGGSSGGSGAAVAAGLLPIAQGSDGAGSIRIPAAFNHVFGFKPSRHRVPFPYTGAPKRPLSTCGPLSHTVADAAAMLDAMSARSRVPPPPRPFVAMADEAPGRLRIRVTTRSPLVTATPAITSAVEAVAGTLGDLGHVVAEGPPPEGRLEEFLPLWQRIIAATPVLRPSVLQPVTRWLRDAGKRLDSRDVDARHHELEARVLAWFGDADLWLTPTVALPPPPVGAWSELGPAAAFEAAAGLGAFTALANVTGQPAASVPMGLDGDGLPMGAQLIGPPGADARVLAVARQLEVARPWADRRPGAGSRSR